MSSDSRPLISHTKNRDNNDAKKANSTTFANCYELLPNVSVRRIL